MKGLILHPEFQLYERQDKAFCSSLQVSEEFEKRHDNVLADIRNLDCSDDFRALNFQEIRWTVDLGQGRTRQSPLFLMTKDGFIMLLMESGYRKNAAFKMYLIKCMNEMEQLIKAYFQQKGLIIL